MSAAAPELLTFTVQKGEEHLPFLVLLQRRIPLAPVGYLRQLLRQGKITRHGESLNAEMRLPVGARVDLPESKRLRDLWAMTTLQILFESRDLLIVAKPPGLAVHSSEGHEGDNLTARCQELLKQRGERFSIAPVHRLDLETSGPLLFGKGKAEGRAEQKNLLGGKGANLHEMTRLGIPVPAGFTITTEVCVHYFSKKGKYPAGLEAQGLELHEAHQLHALQVHGHWVVPHLQGDGLDLEVGQEPRAVGLDALQPLDDRLRLGQAALGGTTDDLDRLDLLTRPQDLLDIADRLGGYPEVGGRAPVVVGHGHAALWVPSSLSQGHARLNASWASGPSVRMRCCREDIRRSPARTTL